MPKKNPKHASSARSTGKTKDISSLGKGKMVKKRNKCQITGCKNISVHSLSKQEWEGAVKKAGLEFETAKGSRKFEVCKDHYKVIKNIKRKDDKSSMRKFDDAGRKTPKRDKIQKFLE